MRAAGAVLVLLAGLPRAGAATIAFPVDLAASHVRIHLGRSGLMKFLGHEHHIEAPLAEGRVEVVEDDPARSSVRLRFEAARLALIPGSEPAQDIPKVEERMRGSEVLDVPRYPGIEFVSTAVRPDGGDSARLRLLVSGTLTLRGRAFPVQVPLELTRTPGALAARGTVELNLRDLGIEPPSVAGVVKVTNRFRLEFEIHAQQAAAQP
jgi:polyisoprenoid-binding protein YceI